MVLKRMVPALVSVLAAAALLAVGSVAQADEHEYRPSEFLGLDLSKAVLSPKPLGPPTEFAPVAVEANSEPNSEARAAPASEPYWAREELQTEPRKITIEDIQVTHPHRIAHVAHAKPKAAARTRLAHRHGNPLDAQAMDTRIQKWPCKSGGICNWKQ